MSGFSSLLEVELCLSPLPSSYIALAQRFKIGPTATSKQFVLLDESFHWKEVSFMRLR